MQLKAKNKELIGQIGSQTVTFGETLKIGDFEITGPGEYEVGGVIITSPEENLYSLHDGNVTTVYWKAFNGSIKTDSKDMGQVDALIISLKKDTSTMKTVLQTINDLSPAAVIPSSPELLDELIKAESAPTIKSESYKVEPSVEEKERQIVLLPCSQG